MRRTWALSLACLLVLGACTGGAPASPTTTDAPPDPTATAPADAVTLAIIHNWAATDPKGPPLNEIFDAFQAEHPHITIEQSVFTFDEIALKVETAFVAGQEPDVVLNNYWPPTQRWLEQGVTIPVNDLLPKWELDGSFDPAALRSFTQADGQIVAFPLEGFNWPVWYNTGILEEAGVEIPTTVDELLAAIPAIRAAGYEPMAAGGAEIIGRSLFRLILQSAMTDDDVRQTFGSGGFSKNENARRGVELFVQLRDAGLFATGSAGLTMGGANQLYYDRKAAMVFDGSWSYTVPEGEVATKTVLGGFPLLEGSPHEKPIYYQAFTAKGVWITRNGSEKLDAVGEFVRFLYRPTNIAKFVEQSAMVPPIVDTPYDDSLVNPLFDQSVRELPKNNAIATFLQDLVVPAAADSATLNVTQLAFVDGTTADEILAQLDAAYTE